MRTVLILAIAAILTACSSSAEPSTAGDPSLLFTNNLPSAWVYITWQDGNAVIGRDSVAPNTSRQCVRFTAQPDSAYFQITATDNIGGVPATSTVTAPYFNPSDRPAWTVDVNADPHGSPAITVQLVEAPC